MDHTALMNYMQFNVVVSFNFQTFSPFKKHFNSMGDTKPHPSEGGERRHGPAERPS